MARCSANGIQETRLNFPVAPPSATLFHPLTTLSPLPPRHTILPPSRRHPFAVPLNFLAAREGQKMTHFPGDCRVSVSPLRFSQLLSLCDLLSLSLFFFISNPLLLLRPQCFLRHFQNFIATIRNCSKEMTINREHLVHRWKTVRDAPKRSTITVVTSWFVVKEPRATRRKTTANRRKKASKQAKKKKKKKEKGKRKVEGKRKNATPTFTVGR